MATILDEAVPRPWIDHYPEGIEWDTPIDTRPVHEQVLAACARTPDAPALDFLGAVTRFGDLGDAITALAGAFQKHLGVGKGTRVALMLPNTPYYVIAYYAILRAGGTVVNCNPLYTVPELAHILDNAGADIIVTLDLKVLFDKAEALCVGGQVETILVCPFPRALPPLKRVLFSLVKRKDLADLHVSRIRDRLVYFHSLLAEKLEPDPVAIDAATDIAVQQYTGGTTGLPKGAMLTHANIAANVSQIDKWGCGLFYPPSKVVAVLPFFHIFAMTVCMNVPLCNGTPVIMLPRFELKALLALLMRTRPNILPAVPTLVHALEKARVDPRALESLDIIVSGGAPLSNEIRAAFGKISKVLLAEGYGLTEASPVVCCAALRVPSKPMSIGQPIPGTDIRFVDIETGKPVPLGEKGELQVRGPQVMVGYYDNPEGTGDAFMDGWLRTGDVGYLDEQGYTFLVDRTKDIIICSGFNIYPRTIEEALLTHPAVDEASVIGAPDEYRGEAPIAFVKLKDGARAGEAELKAHLDPLISRIEMPREILFKAELPKTLIGKLSKKELRAEYDAMRGTQSEPA